MASYTDTKTKHSFYSDVIDFLNPSMEDDKLEFEAESSSSSSELLITQTKKNEQQDAPQLEGTNVYEIEIDKLEDKPWLRPGSDLSDYFNYGFNENTWKVYCAKQRETRNEFQIKYPQRNEAERRYVDQRHNFDLRQTRGESRDHRREHERYRKYDERTKRNDYRRRYD